MTQKCMSKKAAKWTFWIAAVVFVICFAVLLVFPTVYKYALSKQITLTEGSLVTEIWEDIPLPIYEKLYYFNITNSDDFLNNNAPLNVTEVGPYTYVSRWVKKHPIWNSNGTVSYRETRTYQFVQDKSVGTEDDMINSLNGPMIIAADMLKKLPLAARILAAIALRLDSEKIVTSKTVRQLTYEGYKDDIIRLAPLIKPDIPYKDGIFSWLYGKNATNDGLFNVFTGEDDPEKTNKINSWNGEEKLNFWKGDTCNQINGTSIEHGPPLPEKPDTYTFFQSILCRSWTFNYTGDGEHYGVPVRHFESTSMILANGTENPDNACFDINGEKPSGVSDISPCQFGAPAFISFPHFHMADPTYLDSIHGMTPNGEDHGSFLDVEPITGLTVEIAVRFQINLQISRIRGLFQFSNLREGIYPVLWVGLELHLTESWADYFKGKIRNPKIIAYTLLGFLTVAAFLTMLLTLLLCWRPWEKADDDDPLLDIKEEEKCNISKRTLSQDEASYGTVNTAAEDFSTS